MLMNCGDSIQPRPSLGAWLTYGLGSDTADLPGFIAMCPGGMPIKGAENWQSAFLPGAFQGTHVDTKHEDVERLIDALSHQPLCLRLPGVTQEAEARERLCTAYGTIDYEMEDEAGRTETCLGVVGVSAEVRLTAEAVNRAKAA